MVDRQAYIVKPIFKALRLLRLLAKEGRRQSLRDVCLISGLPKSTAFKYLRTLLEAGYIDHDPMTDTYGVGLMLWELGCKVNEGSVLRAAALPVMLDLASTFDESVTLGVLSNRSVLCLEVVDSRAANVMTVRTGDRHCVRSSALGRAILADLPRHDWKRHVPADVESLDADPAENVRATHEIERHIAFARARGFALSRGEPVDGACSIAAAIRDENRTVGAISVSSDLTRLSSDLERHRIVKAVVRSAKAVSLRLQCQSLVSEGGHLDQAPAQRA